MKRYDIYLSSGEIDKHEYLRGKEIFPFNENQMIEQAKYIYYPLEKVFENKQNN